MRHNDNRRLQYVLEVGCGLRAERRSFATLNYRGIDLTRNTLEARP